MTHSTRTRWRIALTATTVLVVTALVSACTGTGAQQADSNVASQNPDVLNIAIATTPDTLDPALNGNGDPLQIVTSLAYESLVVLLPDGTFGPGLATEWGYVGDGNTVFEMTLREGVKFSDGSELTAEGVKASLEHFGAAGGPFAGRIANMQSIDVTGPLSLRITLVNPTPALEYIFSQRSMTGSIISPEALEDPDKLGTVTAGAGQYVLQDDETVTGQIYTFVPNENYYDPEKVQFDKVVVKIIADANAQLQAMQAGEVDYIIGTPSIAGTAAESGFEVSQTPSIIAMAMIFDRGGSQVPALGDERVRQAMNYAIDRDAIASALYGEYGEGSSALSLPGFDSYDESVEDAYPYDPEKAKALLQEAGYEDGFTFNLVAFNLQPGLTDAAQALASEWAKVGITANIVVPVDFADLYARLGDPETHLLMLNYGLNPMQVNGEDWLSGFSNPQKVTDATIDELYLKGNSESDPSARQQDYVQLVKRLSELAWLVPFASTDKISIARPGLEGTEVSGTYTDPNPALFTVSGSN